jgi:hypothetical protein
MLRVSFIIGALAIGFSSEQFVHAQFVETSTNKLYDNNFLLGTLPEPTKTIAGHNGAVIYGISDTGSLLDIGLSPSLHETTIGPLGNDIQALAFKSGTKPGPATVAVSYQDLYSLDLTTGATTLIGQMGNFATSGYVAAFFDNFDTLYLTEQNGLSDSSLYRVDTTTGLASLVGPIGFTVTAVVDGVGFTTAGQIISINLATGAGTFLANQSGLDGIVVGASTSAIPEPSSIILAALGGLVLLMHRRRQRAVSRIA